MKVKKKGFTLLELLIATAIFALIGASAYSGLNGMLKRREAATEVTDRAREMQRGWFILSRDFSLAAARPIREATLGSTEAALLANNQSVTAIVMTHAGRTNPGNLPRSNLQRVGYLIDDGKLKRLVWPVLDQAQDSLPYETVIFNDVDSLNLRFMDDQYNWHEQWPPPNVSLVYPEAYMPIAVDVALNLNDWGTINRLFEIAAINQ
ncbi:MAG: type II secretion system minor pseudopilin GspJ [Gammaproteobacteria bacterium]